MKLKKALNFTKFIINQMTHYQFFCYVDQRVVEKAELSNRFAQI
jgi:hypothetical protein